MRRMKWWLAGTTALSAVATPCSAQEMRGEVTGDSVRVCGRTLNKDDKAKIVGAIRFCTRRGQWTSGGGNPDAISVKFKDLGNDPVAMTIIGTGPTPPPPPPGTGIKGLGDLEATLRANAILVSPY